MIILMLGPQGSGKGTQARLLASKFNLFYFENGAFLRDLAKTNEFVKKTIEEGKLVPFKEMSSYIQAFFDSKAIWDDIIFDGFPRTLEQYQFFKGWLKEKHVTLDLAIVLSIGEETTVKRLSARRQDPETGKIYNLITDPPPSNVHQDKLVQREDDKPEAIRKRLDLYKTLTAPLVNALKSEIKVVEVDGEKSIDEIQNEISKIVEETKNGER